MTETTRKLAQLVEQISRIVRVCSALDNLDQRATLLDATGRMFETVSTMLLAEREPRDGALQVVAVVRQLQRDVATLSRQCEGELQMRSRTPLLALKA